MHAFIHLFPLCKAFGWLLVSKLNNPVEPIEQWTSEQGVSNQWYTASARRKCRVTHEHGSKGTYIHPGRRRRWEVERLSENHRKYSSELVLKTSRSFPGMHKRKIHSKHKNAQGGLENRLLSMSVMASHWFCLPGSQNCLIWGMNLRALAEAIRYNPLHLLLLGKRSWYWRLKVRDVWHTFKRICVSTELLCFLKLWH